MSNALADFRRERGMTLKGLAGIVGVTKATIWKWERRRVPAEQVARLSEATGIDRALLRPDLYRGVQ